jgi:hypothetical protein
MLQQVGGVGRIMKFRKKPSPKEIITGVGKLGFVKPILAGTKDRETINTVRVEERYFRRSIATVAAFFALWITSIICIAAAPVSGLFFSIAATVLAFRLHLSPIAIVATLDIEINKPRGTVEMRIYRSVIRGNSKARRMLIDYDDGTYNSYVKNLAAVSKLFL